MDHWLTQLLGIGPVGSLLGFLVLSGCGGSGTAHIVPLPLDALNEAESGEGDSRNRGRDTLPDAEIVAVDSGKGEGGLVDAELDVKDVSHEDMEADVSDGGLPELHFDVCTLCDVVGDTVEDPEDVHDSEPLDGCIPDCQGKECGSDGCGGVCGQCQQGVCISGKCPPEGKQCDDGNDLDWDGCTDGLLSEFRVNQVNSKNPAYPDVAVGKDGSFLVGWRATVPFQQGSAVVLRMFDAVGAPQGDEFLISAPFSGQQLYARVSVLADGRFVVIWPEVDPGGLYSIKARFVSAEGNATGPSFQINTSAGGQLNSPEVAQLGDGGFVVVWHDSSDAAPVSTSVVRGQRFDEFGVKVGSELLVWGNKTSLGDILAVSSGSCLVSLSVPEGAGGKSDVVLLGLDVSGMTVGVPTLMNQHTDNAQNSSALAVVAGGPVVAVWRSDFQDGDMGGVFARLADSSGKPVGDEFQVNPTGFGPQFEPSIASASDERFVVAWLGNGEGDPDGVFLRLFSQLALPVTGEIPVNVLKVGSQLAARMDAGPGGPIVLVWQNMAPDGLPKEIFARRFDIEGNPLYH